LNLIYKISKLQDPVLMHIKNQSGLSLTGVLVAVALVGVAALGLASLTTSLLSSQSIHRNYTSAHELESVIGGLIGDPGYCRLHFEGLALSGPNAVIRDEVVFKEITALGELGSNTLFAAQTKWDQMKISKISLKSTSRVTPRNYLGEVQIELEALNGGIPLVRKLSLFIATDPTDKIVACGREVNGLATNSTGQYSPNCADFAAAGWLTKMACMQDGRSHLVLRHDSNGGVLEGSVDDLSTHIETGAEVRVSIDSSFIPGARSFYDLCVSTARVGGKVACMTAPRSGVPDWSTPVASKITSHVFFSNGEMMTEAEFNNPAPTKYRVPMNWYISY
jgi:hypothetical protein